MKASYKNTWKDTNPMGSLFHPSTTLFNLNFILTPDTLTLGIRGSAY